MMYYCNLVESMRSSLLAEKAFNQGQVDGLKLKLINLEKEAELTRERIRQLERSNEPT